MATTTAQKSVISLTKGEANYKTAEAVANTTGKLMGTSKVAFDQKFIEPLRDVSIFVAPMGAPTKSGRYQVDRVNHTFKPISKEEWRNFEWHERLYVASNVENTAKQGLPLMLTMGLAQEPVLSNCLALHGFGDVPLALGGHGGYTSDSVAKVAQVPIGHEAAASFEKSNSEHKSRLAKFADKNK